jgi:hypothetical protein
MKKRQIIAVCSAFASFVAFTASAHAVTVTPPGPGGAPVAFTASGPAVFAKGAASIACETTFTGEMNGNGQFSITSVSMRGNSLCKQIEPVMPAQKAWIGAVENSGSLAIDNIAVNINIPSVGGSCGPTTVKASIVKDPVTKETIVTFPSQVLSGGCSLTGTLSTTPPFTVAD